jgi:arylsulfatase A-like enzyme
MNVVVVVARGLRADMLGCYGNLWIETPNLDMLAAGGVLFDWHFADRAGPAAWHSWLTGRYRFADAAADDASDTFNLLKLLKVNGVVTCLVRDTHGQRAVVEPAGWDRVVAVESAEGEEPLDQPLTAADKALKKLAKSERWLLWVELATLLPPWDTPADFLQSYFEAEEPEDDHEDGDAGPANTEEALEPIEPLARPTLGPIDPSDDDLYYRLQSTYAAAASYLDAGIGLLLDKVRELGDSTLVIVTSDGGFPLGEHGMVGVTDAPPHDELVHVPLLVRVPGSAEGGRRVAGLTQAVDLTPTIAEAFGLSAGDLHGRSLWPLLRGETEKVRDYAVAAGAGLCIRTPERALVLPPAETGRTPQLFVKPEDRSEVNDVRQHHLEWAEYLERLLEEFVAATQKPGALEAPALRELV